MAVAAAFLLVSCAMLLINDQLDIVVIPVSIAPSEIAALLVGGAVAAVLGVLDDTLQLRARWQLLGQLALAFGAVAAGITVPFINNPFGPRSIVFTEPFATGFTVVWIVGMINSINFIDGLDGLSSGIALIAAVTLGLISLPTTFSQPFIGDPVLHAGGRAARVPALELPPGLDLHRHQRGDVRRLHARLLRSSARRRWRSPCSCSAYRSSTRSGSSSAA